jgi:hypothetical protein
MNRQREKKHLRSNIKDNRKTCNIQKHETAYSVNEASGLNCNPGWFYQEGKPLIMRNTYALRIKIKTLTRFTEKITKY